MAVFSPPTQRWFNQSFPGPTPVQAQGFAAIGKGAHALLIAPTGSGKTLAAFLMAIDRLVREKRKRPAKGAPATHGGHRILYVSPLKALAYDIERNLKGPLRGIQSQLAENELIPMPEVFVRTGDTPQRERAKQLRHPAEIVVTTPESFFLMLLSKQRTHLASVDAVIIDEIHALAPSKRGAHLTLSLERLSYLCQQEHGHDPQRIGLRPLRN